MDLWIGMATGRVRAGFFDIQTRPVGPPLLPGPNLFNKQVFFLAPNPACRVSAGLVQLSNHFWAYFVAAQFNPIFFFKKKKKEKIPKHKSINIVIS